MSRFPFGEPLARVRPTANGPRAVFLLGVYSSALHARWRYGEGRRDYVAALAVGNEPEPFWDGADQVERIAKLHPPFGTLGPSPLNGVSGRELDEGYLNPMGIRRADCWITDLHDSYLARENQRDAVERAYAHQGRQAPVWTLPMRNGRLVPSEARLASLQEEFETAQPRCLITLGEEPLRVLKLPRLTLENYGRPQQVTVWGRRVCHLAFTHPRNSGRLGPHSATWAAAHDRWRAEIAGTAGRQCLGA